MGQAPRRGSGEPHWRAEEGPHHQAHDPHRPGRRHHTECPSEAAEQGVEGWRHPGEVGQVCIRQDAQEARNSCCPQRFRSLQGHARAQVEVPEACRLCQEDAQVRQVSWTVPWCAAPYRHLASRKKKNFFGTKKKKKKKKKKS